MAPVLMINLAVIHIIGRLEGEESSSLLFIPALFWPPGCGGGGRVVGKKRDRYVNRSPTTISPNP